MAGNVLDYLPDGALVVLDGKEFLSAAVVDIEEESISRRADAEAAGEINPDFPVPYHTWTEIEDRIGEHGVVELGYTRAPEISPLANAFEPGPRFAGKLRDFIEHLKTLTRSDEPWLIISRQASRLKDLWREQQLPLEDASAHQPGGQFIEGTLAGGWTLVQPDGRRIHLLRWRVPAGLVPSLAGVIVQQQKRLNRAMLTFNRVTAVHVDHGTENMSGCSGCRTESNRNTCALNMPVRSVLCADPPC